MAVLAASAPRHTPLTANMILGTGRTRRTVLVCIVAAATLSSLTYLGYFHPERQFNAVQLLSYGLLLPHYKKDYNEGASLFGTNKTFYLAAALITLSLPLSVIMQIYRNSSSLYLQGYYVSYYVMPLLGLATPQLSKAYTYFTTQSTDLAPNLLSTAITTIKKDPLTPDQIGNGCMEDQLNLDVLREIFFHLNMEERSQARQTCKCWAAILGPEMSITIDTEGGLQFQCGNSNRQEVMSHLVKRDCIYLTQQAALKLLNNKTIQMAGVWQHRHDNGTSTATRLFYLIIRYRMGQKAEAITAASSNWYLPPNQTMQFFYTCARIEYQAGRIDAVIELCEKAKSCLGSTPNTRAIELARAFARALTKIDHNLQAEEMLQEADKINRSNRLTWSSNFDKELAFLALFPLVACMQNRALFEIFLGSRLWLPFTFSCLAWVRSKIYYTQDQRDTATLLNQEIENIRQGQPLPPFNWELLHDEEMNPDFAPYETDLEEYADLLNKGLISRAMQDAWTTEDDTLQCLKYGMIAASEIDLNPEDLYYQQLFPPETPDLESVDH